MTDLLLLEQLTQSAAADVRPGVVAHQPLRGDAVLLVEAEGAFEEVDDGRRLLVVVDLGVGEPGVVVDDCVDDVDTVDLVTVLARAVAGDSVAGPLEARVLAGVDMQQIAGAGPLIAVGRRSRAGRGGREIPARLSTFETVE